MSETFITTDGAVTARPQPCRHRRCGNREWHHAADDGGFTDECEPFTLAPNECECREPAQYGTMPDRKCKLCGGTGYVEPGPWHDLTPRERKVAELLCSGMERMEICSILATNIKTYDSIRARVLRRLDVRNNVQLVRMAITKGWVRL